MNNPSLFSSEHLKLSPIDSEKDAPVEAALTMNLDYVRQIQPEMRRPLSTFEVKAYHTELLKELKKGQTKYHFVIRLRDDPDEKMIGFIRFQWIEWSNSQAFLQFAIGDPEMRTRYAHEALALAMQYAFDELNLFRLSCTIPEYDETAWKLHESAGFVREASQREAVYDRGRRWSLYCYGILRSEWAENQKEVQP